MKQLFRGEAYRLTSYGITFRSQTRQNQQHKAFSSRTKSAIHTSSGAKLSFC
ncbi:MAG: hypothetical protein LBJ00_17135 [Planctomycetaceae bacterium]|nr:hypothetical protein [Planctomycetaceae bacterium]